MSIKIEIKDNVFHDDSSAIRTVNNYDFTHAEKELAEIKSQLSADSKTYRAVEELELAVRHREKRCIGDTIKKYAIEFASATFANLASGALLSFLFKV